MNLTQAQEEVVQALYDKSGDYSKAAKVVNKTIRAFEQALYYIRREQGFKSTLELMVVSEKLGVIKTTMPSVDAIAEIEKHKLKTKKK